MNKNEFLNELREKLKLLDSSEIDDIINEYCQTIDEKIKDGKTEFDAVKDFGDIDELSKEILSAYKINPNYAGKKDNNGFDNFVNDINEGIRYVSTKIVEFGNNLINKIKVESNSDKDTSVIILELLLKVMLILFIITLLRIPFLIISSIGSSILRVGDFEFSKITVITFKLLMEIIYVIACVYFVSLIVKKFVFNSTNKKNLSKTTSNNKDTVFSYKEDVNNKTKDVKEKNTVSEDKNDDIVKVNNFNQSDYINNTGCSIVIITIFKIFILLFFVLPILVTILVGAIILLIAFSFTASGLPGLGLCVGIIGGLIFLISLFNIFIGIITDRNRFRFTPIIISIILVLVGASVFINDVLKIDYISNPYRDNFSIQTLEYTFNINDKIEIDSGNYIISKEVDNTIPVNKIYLVIKYSDIFVEKIDVNEFDNYVDIEHVNYEENEFMQFKRIIKRLKQDIKQNKIYDYSKLTDIYVEIKANEQTIEKIELTK